MRVDPPPRSAPPPTRKCPSRRPARCLYTWWGDRGREGDGQKLTRGYSYEASLSPQPYFIWNIQVLQISLCIRKPAHGIAHVAVGSPGVHQSFIFESGSPVHGTYSLLDRRLGVGPVAVQQVYVIQLHALEGRLRAVRYMQWHQAVQDSQNVRVTATANWWQYSGTRVCRRSTYSNCMRLRRVRVRAMTMAGRQA